ncbi:LysR family transcriptional regulator [Thalassotalea euphylliae]|uniref:LysR family transcriptional regulator n=1 Tax=Thalassotalea euphylliae TaxID=1655234 RepID=A0A3E0U638_9GAMM|nr:LysR family transcriptional regulator [Thalassotalea euphylliae]REL32230.1 LysR family transcriptional regulator [Thalassotalea euphylliae]
MNIDHLKLFVRVAATHNISMAGSEFGLSPAVASAHISKLEESLGVRLMHRTTRKVSLTDEGETLLPIAEEILANVDVDRSSVGSGSLAPSGTLRITAPASFGRMHIMPGLSGFMAQYPKLKIDLRLSDNIVDLVEGGFDIAIRDAALNDSSLKARKLAQDNRKIVASPKYLEQHGIPQTPEDLTHHQSVNLFGLEVWQFAAKQGTKNIKTNTVLRVDNGEAVRDACAAGLGIAITSTWCSYEKLNAGELVEILSDYPLKSSTDIWALYPNTRLVAPKVRAFIDYFIDYFKDNPNLI